jgi:hypothetical protein
LLDEDAPSEGGLARRLDSLTDRLDRIEAAVNLLVQQRSIKDWYTTAERGGLLALNADFRAVKPFPPHSAEQGEDEGGRAST